MSLTILTACTSKKTTSAVAALQAKSLQPGSISHVGDQWLRQINDADATTEAARLYAGRDYKRLRGSTPGEAPYIVSAGLGLVAPGTLVPAYDATVSMGVENSIFSKIQGTSSLRQWFEMLQSRSRYAMPFRDLPADGLILAALPARYLGMVEDDLNRLAPGRLRLFTASSRDLSAKLEPYRMPYDGLLSDVPGFNGPIVGMAERALVHFLTQVLPDCPLASAEEHKIHVRDRLRTASQR